MEPQNSFKTTYIAIIIGALVVFVLIIGLLYGLSGKNNGESAQTQKTTEKTTVTPTKIVTKGSLMLITYMSSVKKNEKLTLTVIGDSAGLAVSGYDALIAYDKDAFDFTEGISKVNDFSLFTFKRDSHITVTAVKDLKSNTPTVFFQQPVMTLVFMPKKTGNFAFSVKSQIGKETTQLVTTKSEKLNPPESTVTVNVQ